MSIEYLNKAFSAEGLTHSEKFVLIALSNYATEDGYAWPSQHRLAAMTSMGARSVRNQLTSLEEKGFISRSHRYKDGKRDTDGYKLLPENFAGSTRHAESLPARHAESLPANLAAYTKELTKVKTKDLKPIHQLEQIFEQFWTAYPKHVGKTAAKKKFLVALASGVSPDLLVEAARRYADERSGQDPQFTAHAATWLNAGRWEDEPTSPPEVPGKALRSAPVASEGVTGLGPSARFVDAVQAGMRAQEIADSGGDWVDGLAGGGQIPR